MKIAVVSGAERWSFWLRLDAGGSTGYIVLDSYTVTEGRKPWDAYYRLSPRDSRIKREEVPVPLEIIEQAKDLLCAEIRKLNASYDAYGQELCK